MKNTKSLINNLLILNSFTYQLHNNSFKPKDN